MQSDKSLTTYIQEHLDTAITRGDIVVYCQPIIRSLTGKCCGFEALARWDDPLHGIIGPKDFVPALEEAGTCYLLDAYVLNHVCRTFYERCRRGLPVTNVMVNLSRTDFSACDVFGMIESAVKKYEVVRHYLMIEIDEEAVISCADAVYDLVGQLRHVGIKVALSHFGRQMAPIVVLEQLNFDAVKFDVRLLQTLDNRKKQLLRYTVNMLKAIQIHMVAVGVETTEQATFLNEIGCEMMQGFYFGRPELLPVQFEHLAVKQILFEDNAEASAYRALGSVRFSEDDMFAVVRYDRQETNPEKAQHYLFMNEKLRQYFADMGFNDSVETYDDILITRQSAMQAKAYRAAKKAAEGKETVSFFSEVGERSLYLTVKCISKIKDVCLLWVTFTDVTKQNQHYSALTNSHLLHNIANAYHTVYRVMNENAVEVITSAFPGENAGDIIYGLPNPALRERVYWKDRKRFWQASDFHYVKQKLKKTARGFYTDLYRIKTESGDYVWQEAMVIGAMGRGQVEYLFCLKISAAADAEDPADIGRLLLGDADEKTASSDASEELAITPENLWQSLIHQGNLEIFWRDRDQKIRGMSDYLYKHRHLSDTDIIGKTAQMAGWQVDEDMVADDKAVLEKGAVILAKPEQFVMDGVLQHIRTTKFPIYHHGKIAGLMSYMVDVDAARRSTYTFDAKIGALTTFGFFSSLSWFEGNYVKTGRNYALAIVSVPVCRSMRNAYEAETVDALEQKIIEIGKWDLDNSAAVAKVRDGMFAALGQDTHFEEKVARWCEDMKGITAVRGYHCQVTGTHAVCRRNRVASSVQLFWMTSVKINEVNGDFQRITPEVLNLLLVTLQRIFDHVQVIDVRRLKRVSFDTDGYARDQGNCWELFGGQRRCPNCIAMQTMRTHESAKALQYIDDKILLMWTFYVEVGDLPYVIGTTSVLDESLFEGIGGKKSLAGRLKQLNREIYMDPLTGINNRRFYDEQMAESAGEAVAFIDVDEFKSVNDTYGHHAGDVILKKVAAAIKDSLDETAFAVRYGGDEFVIIFPQMDNRDALERTLEAISDNVRAIRTTEDGMKNARFSVSIGAAYGDSIVRHLVLMADRELYRVKARRKGTISVANYQK